VRVRPLIGVDPQQRAVAISVDVLPGQRLAFCRRDVQTARTDLVRICAEIREALEPRQALTNGGAAEGDPPRPASPRILGAHYVSCAARDGARWGELHTIQQALGDVPLTGFLANGEVAYRYLYGYAGVLTVFAENAVA
jgi:small ligand-binding sensory domain FIST